MNAPIRLLLIDDHVLFREGLARLLSEEGGLVIAGQCSGVADALEFLSGHAHPDMLLLDFDLGEQNGFAFLQGARDSSYAGKVLMVTAGMSHTDSFRAISAGASGVLLKHAPPNELIAAIRKVLRDEPLYTPTELAAMREAARAEDARRPAPLTLSPREHSVMRGIFRGLANKEIAGELDISEGAVKAVLQQLFAKTGVRTRAQLVRIALEQKIGTGS